MQRRERRFGGRCRGSLEILHGLAGMGERGMEQQVKTQPTFHVHRFPPGIGVFQHDSLDTALDMQDRPDLDQLPHDVGVPVAGNGFLL